MQVLLVEDNLALAQAIERALRAAGFSVNHVDRGETALVALRTAHPDILILDLGLPGMDGLEVLRTARREQFTNPVLILTISPNPLKSRSCWRACVRWSGDWAA